MKIAAHHNFWALNKVAMTPWFQICSVSRRKGKRLRATNGTFVGKNVLPSYLSRGDEESDTTEGQIGPRPAFTGLGLLIAGSDRLCTVT